MPRRCPQYHWGIPLLKPIRRLPGCYPTVAMFELPMLDVALRSLATKVALATTSPTNPIFHLNTRIMRLGGWGYIRGNTRLSVKSKSHF